MPRYYVRWAQIRHDCSPHLEEHVVDAPMAEAALQWAERQSDGGDVLVEPVGGFIQRLVAQMTDPDIRRVTWEDACTD